MDRIAVLLEHTPIDVMSDHQMAARTNVKCLCDSVWRTAQQHAEHVHVALASDHTNGSTT